MVIAQKLYEAGFITYMRTDSLNLSDLALADIAADIKSNYGERYLKTRRWHTNSKGAQEAHEAIRPTYINREHIEGTPQEQRLYTLIRRRTLASQMSDAEIEKTNVDISISGRSEHFQASGEVVTFPGFLRVYSDEDGAESHFSSEHLPALAVGDELREQSIVATERFTQAPARYTEASLVKKMEELGIGRPSTYAPTISTIQSREYVERGEHEGRTREYSLLTLSADGQIAASTATENVGSDKGRLLPTDIGLVVNDFLTQYFPDILDYNFTARVEEKFDEIAEGKLAWNREIDEFYRGFHPDIEKISAMRMEHKVGERVLGTDPATGKPVSVKIGRFGPLVQIGEGSDEEKPQFASLLKGQSVATITLEEALKLFELPRTLGEFEGKVVVAAIGRFGPYVRHDGKFVSIPKNLTAQTITLAEAQELIEAKRKEEASKVLKEFEEMEGLQLINGRYGVYLAYKAPGAKKAENFKLPAGIDAEAITFEQAQKIMADAAAAPKSGAKRKAASRTKSATKATGTAKATAKKTAK
jgi:DNA topoisomerase-1